MKNNKFIKLTPFSDGSIFYINSMGICAIKDLETYRIVETLGGLSYYVKESTQEIFKLIEKSENITFITK